jgi:hypothetical protein
MRWLALALAFAGGHTIHPKSPRPPDGISHARRVLQLAVCDPGYEHDSQGNCRACGAGMSDHDGLPATECVACPPGTAASAATECTPCARGRFASTNQSTTCAACEAGQSSGTGAATCSASAFNFLCTPPDLAALPSAFAAPCANTTSSSNASAGALLPAPGPALRPAFPHVHRTRAARARRSPHRGVCRGRRRVPARAADLRRHPDDWQRTLRNRRGLRC